MRAVFSPSKARGEAVAPPSKSMTHRLLICAGLAQGESVIRGVAPSDDVLATLDCLEALGVQLTFCGDAVRIQGIGLSGRFSGAVLPCRECASTLRFFIPIALLTGADITMTGSSKLLSRPLSVYEDICAVQGLRFERKEDSIRLRGRLSPAEFEFSGGISSQFASGLMFALPLLDGDSTIKLTQPVESRPYIDMTLHALKLFSIRAEWTADDRIFIPGNQRYVPREDTVEGDYSNAAFLEALNIMGGSVNVTGLSPQSLQGDRIYKQLFDMLKEGCAPIDISDCLDLGPVLFAAAAALKGCVFTGTQRLRIKESDRIRAMAEELKKLGAEVEADEDTVRVHPGLRAPAEPLWGHNDHRIVMALSILLSGTGGEIWGIEAVKKSFPDFFEGLIELGIDVKVLP